MASVNLKKSDKTTALTAMVRAKFLDRYKELDARRRELTQRVYDETVGAEGWVVAAALARTEGKGVDPREWVNYRSSLVLKGVNYPLFATNIKGNGYQTKGTCLFSLNELRKGYNSGEWRYESPSKRRVSLPTSVPWPATGFGDEVTLDDALAPTRRMGATLNRHTAKFLKEVGEFYSEAESIISLLRTTKQVDNMFPELWDYLPEGLRQRMRQGLVPFDQSSVDALRKKLPKKSKG